MRFHRPLRRLGITSVGTSYDPITGIRGPGRERRRSGVYNHQFMRGVHILEQAGFGWGLIYVVTRRSLADPVGLFYFLTNLSPRGSVMFNPVLLYGDDPLNLAITPEEYVGILAVVLWGGTRAKTYGYATQHHLEPVRTCETPQGCVEAGGAYHEVFSRVMNPLK